MNLLFYSTGGGKSKTGLMEQNQGASRASIIFEGFREESFLAFSSHQRSPPFLDSWSPSIFKASNGPASPYMESLQHWLLSASLFHLLRTLMITWAHPGRVRDTTEWLSTLIIQHELSILRALISNFNPICNLNSPFLHNLTSQILEIRGWTS